VRLAHQCYAYCKQCIKFEDRKIFLSLLLSSGSMNSWLCELWPTTRATWHCKDDVEVLCQWLTYITGMCCMVVALSLCWCVCVIVSSDVICYVSIKAVVLLVKWTVVLTCSQSMLYSGFWYIAMRCNLFIYFCDSNWSE